VRPSVDQIREDIAACEKIGAEEVILAVGFTLGGQSLTNWQKLLAGMSGRADTQASRGDRSRSLETGN